MLQLEFDVVNLINFSFFVSNEMIFFYSLVFIFTGITQSLKFDVLFTIESPFAIDFRIP